MHPAPVLIQALDDTVARAAIQSRPARDRVQRSPAESAPGGDRKQWWGLRERPAFI